MGDRGPPPKYDAETARLLGNPGNRALPPPADEAEDEPITFPDILEQVPTAPDWLHGTDDTAAMAVNAWQSIAAILVNSRQFREGDQAALARYCRYLAEWVALTNDIDNLGRIITNTGPKGGETTIANPAFRARGQIETGIAALERELGLSPKSRIEVQRRLMAALQDTPAINASPKKNTRNGPIGSLLDDDE